MPPAKHDAFVADLCAHLAAYATGFLGGVCLCVQTLVRRRRAKALVDREPYNA